VEVVRDFTNKGESSEMRYWCEAGRDYPDLQYWVEYFGITRHFCEIGQIRALRRSLKSTRRALVWHVVGKRLRSLRKRRRVGFTVYHFNNPKSIFRYIPFGGNILFFWDWSYPHWRYHLEIRAFLAEAYETFDRESNELGPG